MADLDGVADDVQGDLGGDRLVGVDDLEVDVGDGAAHRVALDLAREHEEVLAVGVEVDQGVEPLLARDRGAEGLGVHRDGQRVDAGPVDDGRDRPVAAQAAGRARPERALGGGVKGDLGHLDSLGGPRVGRAGAPV